MKKIISIMAIVCVSLAGCEPPQEVKYPRYEIDGDKRQENFIACLKALPAGPDHTKYNDWDEVVDSCSEAARASAFYCYENCPPKPDEAMKDRRT